MKREIARLGERGGPGERASRSDPVTRNAPRDLKERVAQHERAEHPSHLNLVQMQFGHHERRRDGNIHSQDVRHEAEPAEEHHDLAS